MILQRIIPSHHPARCEHAEKGRENPTLRSFEVRSRPPTDWYRRLPCLYRSTVSLDRSPRDSKVQNWTQILPTSGRGVGKGVKMVDLSNTDFWYKPRAVSFGTSFHDVVPFAQNEQRPSDPCVGPMGPPRAVTHTPARTVWHKTKLLLRRAIRPRQLHSDSHGESIAHTRRALRSLS